MDNNKIGLFDLISIGVGCVIGAGIFSMLGYGIAYTGRGIVIALFIAMLLVVLQSVKYPIVSRMFELDGGVYGFDSLTCPRWVTGFQAANDVFFKIGTLSVTAIAFTQYLEVLFPALIPHHKITAIVVTTLSFAIVIVGTSFAAKVQNIMCVLMYIALGIFVVYGFMNYNPEAYAGEPLLINGFTGLMMGAALMSYTCNGFQYVISMGKTVKNPTRNIPLAFFLSALISAGIYALIGFAATHAFSYGETAGVNLGDLAKLMMPNGLYMFFLVGGALFALGTSLVGGISAGVRPLIASARDGWLPAFCAKETKNGTSYILALYYVVSIIPIILGLDLNDLVTMQLVPLGVVTICSSLTSFNIPVHFAKEWREAGFKMSLGMYRLLIALSVIASATLALYCFLSNGYKVVTIVITVLLFVYGILRDKSGKVKLHSHEVYKPDVE